MKKRLVTMVSVLLLSLFPLLPACAAGVVPRLVDEADLLSDSEEMDLADKLDEISERHQVDIAVVTVDSLEGESVVEYADDFYDDNGYGFGNERDGILFLISMEERDWYISTRGYGVTAVTDAGREYMTGIFIDALQEGDYAAAFTIFADLCDDFITQAEMGEPYGVDNLPQEPFGVVGNLVIALGAGFAVALIVTGIMRLQLKSVYNEPAADNYIKSGSMKVTDKKELFLYRHVERREKPKDDKSEGAEESRTHTSSSGAKHGGGGGKF